MVTDAGLVDEITRTFLDTIVKDMSLIKKFSTTIFYYLAVIQIFFTAMTSALEDASLKHFFVRLIQLLLLLSACYGLVLHGGEWIPSLLNGFASVAQEQDITTITPSSVMVQGISIVALIMKVFYGVGLLSHPFIALVGAIESVLIICLYGMITAELSILLIKTYCVVAVGGVFFAFGALNQTRVMTTNYIRVTLGLGLQLMVLFFLLTVGEHMGDEWVKVANVALAGNSVMPLFMLFSGSVVYLMVLKTIPGFIADLAGFSHIIGSTSMAPMSTGTSNRSFTIPGGSLIRPVSHIVTKGVGIATQVGIQGTRAVGHTARSVTYATQHTHSLRQGLTKTGKNIAGAGKHTIQDIIAGHHADLNLGRKFNLHLANRVNDMNQRFKSDNVSKTQRDKK